MRIFPAKEAVYKAQHAATGRLFGFGTLHVMLEDEASAAIFPKAVPPLARVTVLRGRHLVTRSHLVAVRGIAAA